MSNAAVTADRWGVASEEADPDVVTIVRQRAGSLPQIALSYEADSKLLWITLKPEPKPVFTLPVVESVRKVQLAIRDLWRTHPDRPVLYLAYRAAGTVFSLGGDLDYYLDCLTENDRSGLEGYARCAADVIKMNRSGIEGSVLTLATVQGRAMGGGIDPARACNVMIAEEKATFCYPEVNYNHFPISAVPILSRHTGFIEAERILLSGRDYAAQEFLDRGALDAVVPTATGEEWVRAYASRTLGTHSARIALIAAINRQAGDLEDELRRATAAWVSHIMSLKPMEIYKLQRIAAAQERLLGRLLRPAQQITQA